MTVFAAVALGVLIGLSLGALGGGGSILTVPALVFVISEPARAATTESLVIVGITALVAAIGHARAGHVRWATGIAFGVIGIIASYAGTALNRKVDPNALLLAFAALMVIAAVAMLIRLRGNAHESAPEPAAVAAAAAGTTRTRSITATIRPESSTSPPADAAHGRTAIDPATAAKVAAAGLVVGFLTGFFGVGGGFVVVPALVMTLSYEMPLAVGTSLLIIAFNSAAALVARAGNETFHWSVIVPFTIAAVAGSLAGKRLADKVSSTTLTRAFVGLLFAVAAYVAIRSGIGLIWR